MWAHTSAVNIYFSACYSNCECMQISIDYLPPQTIGTELKSVHMCARTFRGKGRLEMNELSASIVHRHEQVQRLALALALTLSQFLSCARAFDINQLKLPVARFGWTQFVGVVFFLISYSSFISSKRASLRRFHAQSKKRRRNNEKRVYTFNQTMCIWCMPRQNWMCKIQIVVCYLFCAHVNFIITTPLWLRNAKLNRISSAFVFVYSSTLIYMCVYESICEVKVKLQRFERWIESVYPCAAHILMGRCLY